MSVRLRAKVVSILIAAVGSLGPLAAPTAAAQEADPAERRFLTSCASCHGPRGEGGRGPTLVVPRLSRAHDRKSLMKLIASGVPGTEMPGHRLPPRELAQLAAFVERLGRRPPERVPGDPARGAALYRGKGACPTCHAIAGEGGALGTDLTDVGLRRGAAYLKASLLEPEADVPKTTSPYRSDATITQNFLQVRVTTSDGRQLQGVRVNEDTFSIQIRDVANQVHSLWKAELTDLTKDWGRSPMPSYKEALSGAEIDDLVAYLLSLRAEPARAAAEEKSH
jgi:cytochrome c oxidase cbb3-type subunit III